MGGGGHSSHSSHALHLGWMGCWPFNHNYHCFVCPTPAIMERVYPIKCTIFMDSPHLSGSHRRAGESSVCTMMPAFFPTALEHRSHRNLILQRSSKNTLFLLHLPSPSQELCPAAPMLPQLKSRLRTYRHLNRPKDLLLSSKASLRRCRQQRRNLCTPNGTSMPSANEKATVLSLGSASK